MLNMLTKEFKARFILIFLNKVIWLLFHSSLMRQIHISYREWGESNYQISCILFFKDFIYLFLNRGVGWEKEGERDINVWLLLARPLLGTWPAPQACALTGNQTSNPLVLRLVLNPLSRTSRDKISYILKLVWAL